MHPRVCCSGSWNSGFEALLPLPPLPSALHSSHREPSALGQGGRRVKLPGWLYISAQNEVLRVVAASAFTACQPVRGSVGPVSVNWSHFPTCFPSTGIWLRPCWDLWPSFPHDQVGSCCMQCLSLPQALWSPLNTPTPLHAPPPKKGSLVPFSAPDLHKPPSQNPGTLGRNDP